MLTFFQFVRYPALHYGFSVRQDGSMHRHLETRNRVSYFENIGVNPARVVTADLAQGARVESVDDNNAGTMVAGTDGLITKTKNLFLSATAADCFLLYFYDPTQRVIGIAHAGWRGILAGIVKNATDAMSTQCGASVENIMVGIGPGIRKCHFAISPADQEKFRSYPDFIVQRDANIFVGLPGIIEFQLLERGVPREHIEDAGVCTYCADQHYFSYRRDKLQVVQSMVGYIGLE